MSSDVSPISQVLEKIDAVATELAELREDVKVALTHGGDIEQLKADIVRIDEHLTTINTFMAGPPALTERLAALERKQEREHQEDTAGVKSAGTADDPAHRKSSRGQADAAVGESEERQARINLDLREDLGVLERAIFDLMHASLKTKASLLLGALVVIFVLSRALGA